MVKLKKTWREKLLDSKDMPKVVEVSAAMSQKWGTGTCVIPAPIEVDGIMRSVPDGKLKNAGRNIIMCRDTAYRV